MKVLQILPELNVGGVETGTVDFAKYLTARGHAALVVSSGGALVAELEKRGIKHYKLAVHQKSLWAVLKSIGALKKIILTEKVDIVHARSRVPAWIAYFAAHHTPAAFITTCHGHYGNHIFSRVMGWAKLVITPSEAIGKHMVETFGVAPHNIRVIARSVDLEKFSVPRDNNPGKSSCVVSIVGRLTPLKGHRYFLKAMAKVVRLVPYVKIWIIGDAPEKKESYKQELLVLTRQLGLSDHVEFLGNRRDIPQLLAKTDCLVLATVTEEAFGRVILEAQAAGVPVVATKVGGVAEVIEDGKTGLLVLPKDPEAMAQEVTRILKDRKLAESLVKEARQRLCERFTLEHMAGATVKVYEELLHSLNILVIKISSIGDVVLVTASLKALKEKFPLARIYCLVGKESRAILQRCPYIEDLIVYDYNEADKGVRGFWRLARRLRNFQFDKVIDFQNNRKSHLLAFLSYPKESYGYRRKWGFLLTDSLKETPGPLAPVEHQFQVLNRLGIEFKKEGRLQLWPSSKDEQYVESLLESEWMANSEHIVGINIAASEKWVTKNWPLSHIARLCDILAGKNIRVVITGTEKDQDRTRKLLKMTKVKPGNLVGKTDIMELAALMKRCRVYVTPDSAPMHVAAAMGTPFIAFFGPTDARRHLPPAEHAKVFAKELPCVPCYSSSCRIKTHACMLSITPEEVAREIGKFLGMKI